MIRSIHPQAPGLGSTARILALVAAVALAWSCSRTIEDDEPPELAEHRIEPCRQWCDAMQSPDCGRIDDPQPFASAQDCLDDCAAVESEYEWSWGTLPDGTDACAEEWYAVAACMGGLTCEEQRSYFRRPPDATEFPCKTELMARSDCYYDWRDEQEGAT